MKTAIGVNPDQGLQPTPIRVGSAIVSLLGITKFRSHISENLHQQFQSNLFICIMCVYTVYYLPICLAPFCFFVNEHYNVSVSEWTSAHGHSCGHLSGRFSAVLPAQHPCAGPVAAILENLLEDPTWLWFLRPCSQGLWQLFPKVGMTIEINILEVLVDRFVSPILQNRDINKITTKTNGRCESAIPGGISQSNIGITWGHGWMALLAKHQTYNSLPLC